MKWWVRFRGSSTGESQQAIVDADHSLANAEARTDEVQAVVTEMHELAKRNHFIERLNMHVARGH